MGSRVWRPDRLSGLVSGAVLEGRQGQSQAGGMAERRSSRLGFWGAVSHDRRRFWDRISDLFGVNSRSWVGSKRLAQAES